MLKMVISLRNKQGSQMAEAAVSLPVIILAGMLMLRMFVFCIEILTVEIKEHREALEAQSAYRGALIRTYEKSRDVSLLRGGLLKMDVRKRLDIRAYMINEDLLVRSDEILD